MKDLDQLKKDYKQLGKTIAELEKPKSLRWVDLSPGTLFMVREDYAYSRGLRLRLKNTDGGEASYAVLLTGGVWGRFNPSSIEESAPVVICDINGNPLEDKK